MVQNEAIRVVDSLFTIDNEKVLHQFDMETGIETNYCKGVPEIRFKMKKIYLNEKQMGKIDEIQPMKLSIITDRNVIEYQLMGHLVLGILGIRATTYKGEVGLLKQVLIVGSLIRI